MGVRKFCGDSFLCSPKNHPQSIMDYFELYYAYLAWCEKDNWANMRDPNHDYMEWNHTLPQCIFGDLPFGQWLTLKQHAIASGLQTLCFDRSCLYGTHFKYLPPVLRELCKEVRNRTRFTFEYQSEKGKLGGRAGRGKPKRNTLENLSKLTQRLEKARECRTSEGLARGGKVAGKKNGKLVMSYRYQCTVTGFISTAPALTRYQKARGIDPSNRIKLN